MNLFRNAIIPSSSSLGSAAGARPKSPPPVPPPRKSQSFGYFTLSHIVTGGRPPPDYSPYQGPGGGRGRRY